jgi:hypothetical protein
MRPGNAEGTTSMFSGGVFAIPPSSSSSPAWYPEKKNNKGNN